MYHRRKSEDKVISRKHAKIAKEKVILLLSLRLCVKLIWANNAAGGPTCVRPPVAKGRGWGLMREELVPVYIFFLNESHRHHSILLETPIELAAIDSECGRGAHLVAAELLEH